jgi:hypothetical protein
MALWWLGPVEASRHAGRGITGKRVGARRAIPFADRVFFPESLSPVGIHMEVEREFRATKTRE